MTPKNSDRKVLFITMGICGVLLLVGILLMVLLETASDLWILGLFLAGLNATFLVLLVIYGKTHGIFSPWKPHGEAGKDQLRKRIWVGFGITVVLDILMLVFWFNSFSLALGIGIGLGAVGAVLLVYKDANTVKGLAIAIGVITGILMTVVSAPGTGAVGTKYDYYVNGVKVGSGSGCACVSDVLFVFLGTAVLVSLLIIGIAYGIRKLCSITK